jgi:serine protease Do
MKKIGLKLSILAFGAALLLPSALLAQKEEKEVKEKEVKEKEVKEMKELDQIIITRKGTDKEKVVVEINGDKITINGKPIEEYKDKEGNISVRRSRHNSAYESLLGYSRTPQPSWENINGNNFEFFGEDSKRAMLGVTTDKTEEGVKIQTISPESAAAKAGLKEKDIITRVDETKIEDPDDLSEAIRKHQPGDKVTVTYLRDKKEAKTSAELGKYKGFSVFETTPGFKMDMDDMNFGDAFKPRIQTNPGLKTPYGQQYKFSGGGPKLGLSVQDTDDGKGVKIIEVDDESNAAKAGIKKDDVVTEVDSKAVNGADEMAKVIRESKDKTSVMMKVLRAGKTQNIEVKIPKKLKTADL